RDARIILMTSTDGGATWGPPAAIDPYNGPGHQLMPAMTITAGKVAVVFYDFRDDVSGAFQPYIVDYTGIVKRHTMDVRVAQADPSAAPQFGPSVKVSQYLT